MNQENLSTLMKYIGYTTLNFLTFRKIVYLEYKFRFYRMKWNIRNIGC